MNAPLLTDIRLSFRCDECGAEPGSRCATMNDEPRRPHRGRGAPKAGDVALPPPDPTTGKVTRWAPSLTAMQARLASVIDSNERLRFRIKEGVAREKKLQLQLERARGETQKQAERAELHRQLAADTDCERKAALLQLDRVRKQLRKLGGAT